MIFASERKPPTLQELRAGQIVPHYREALELDDGAISVGPRSNPSLPQKYTPVADGKNESDNNQTNYYRLRFWVEVHSHQPASVNKHRPLTVYFSLFVTHETHR